jgi:hypothetical protein
VTAVTNKSKEGKTWVSSLLDFAQSALSTYIPGIGVIGEAKDFISESVAQRIRDQACEAANTLMADTHRQVIFSIVWQNSVLLLSLLPVYLLQSALPFYIAYVCVAGYTIYSLVHYRDILFRLIRTRSITETLATEIHRAIEVELTKRQFVERKAVEWLGPDLKRLSSEVAVKIKPDVLIGFFNIGFTLFMAFIAFRIFAIPLLEQRALFH